MGQRLEFLLEIIDHLILHKRKAPGNKDSLSNRWDSPRKILLETKNFHTISVDGLQPLIWNEIA
jgi:hypothetical protein